MSATDRARRRGSNGRTPGGRPAVVLAAVRAALVSARRRLALRRGADRSGAATGDRGRAEDRAPRAAARPGLHPHRRRAQDAATPSRSPPAATIHLRRRAASTDLDTGGIPWGTECRAVARGLALTTPWPAPGLSCWSMIGKVGRTGQPFEIGTGTTFTRHRRRPAHPRRQRQLRERQHRDTGS